MLFSDRTDGSYGVKMFLSAVRCWWKLRSCDCYTPSILWIPLIVNQLHLASTLSCLLEVKWSHVYWRKLLLFILNTRVARVVLCQQCLFVCLSVCFSLCLSVSAIILEPLEISAQNFQGIILWLKGRTNSKMAIHGCAGGDLTSLMLYFVVFFSFDVSD